MNASRRTSVLLDHSRCRLCNCTNSHRRAALAPLSGQYIFKHHYYSPGEAARSQFSRPENAILSAAIPHVPSLGFTQDTLVRGALDAGYMPASTALFSRGPYDLVHYYLINQRFGLRKMVQFSQQESNSLGPEAKIRILMKARIQANAPLAHKYSEAIALMSLASNIRPSLAELGRLADEFCYLAGDANVDTSWYTRRGALASVYAASEVFMTQDKSRGFGETTNFLDRRLDDVKLGGKSAANVAEWVGFTGMAAVNLSRSLGARI